MAVLLLIISRDDLTARSGTLKIIGPFHTTQQGKLQLYVYTQFTPALRKNCVWTLHIMGRWKDNSETKHQFLQLKIL